MPDAIRESGALKIYICNIMTQDGETEGMTAEDHVCALLEHGGPGLVDICLCNSDPIGPSLLERYSHEDAEPMRVDPQAMAVLGAEVVYRSLMDGESGYARHSGIKVAQAVLDLYEQRADTKIF